MEFMRPYIMDHFCPRKIVIIAEINGKYLINNSTSYCIVVIVG
jgi:hypothetical protein